MQKAEAHSLPAAFILQHSDLLTVYVELEKMY